MKKQEVMDLGKNGVRLDWNGITVICELNSDGSVRFDAFDHNTSLNICQKTLNNPTPIKTLDQVIKDIDSMEITRK